MPNVSPQSLLVGILALGTAVPASSLEPTKDIGQYSHAAWQETSGHPSDFVSAILQTSDGDLWVGTLSGLARFDGTRFSAFGPPQGSLLHRISALYEAGDKSLWIGSRGGLTRYHDGQFESFSMPEGYRRTGVRTIVEDAAGRIWVRTLTDLFVLDASSLRFVAARVRGLARTAPGTLRVATWQGLGRIENDRVVLESRAEPVAGEPYPIAYAEAVLLDDDGGAWVGATWGLGRLDPQGRWTVFGTADGLPGREVQALHRDRGGA